MNNKSAWSMLPVLVLVFVMLAFPAIAAANSTPLVFTPDIVGIWQGDDALGEIQVTITAGMQFTISHPGCDLLDEEGTYLADVSSITVTYDNGAFQIFRYLVAGDTMLLADETLQFPVVLTRIPGNI